MAHGSLFCAGCHAHGRRGRVAGPVWQRLADLARPRKRGRGTRFFPPLMSLTITAYLLVALILLASSVLQGAVGFASGLFGIPLLMLTGIALPEAVAISLVASAVQNCTAAWQLRHEID